MVYFSLRVDLMWSHHLQEDALVTGPLLGLPLMLRIKDIKASRMRWTLELVCFELPWLPLVLPPC